MNAPVVDLAQRADAQRNRRLLLAAAAEAFAERGIDVPAEEIARRAGVAKGTLFRHFPAKEDLVAAVVIDRLGQVRELVVEISAGRAVGLAAIAEFMERAAELIAADHSFFEAAAREAGGRISVHQEKVALERELSDLLARAQAGGHVRSDIVGADILMLILAATNTCAPAQSLCPQLWRRYLALMVDALRPGQTTRLPVPPLDVNSL